MTKQINEVSVADAEAFVKLTHDNTNLLDLYQGLAIRSAIYPGKGTPFGLMYAALGLAEAGEVQNKVKKLFRDDGILYFDKTWHEDEDERAVNVVMRHVSDERKQQIVKELGGVLWYVAAVCQELNINMSEVAVTNLKEIADRAKRGTLSGDGDNR